MVAVLESGWFPSRGMKWNMRGWRPNRDLTGGAGRPGPSSPRSFAAEHAILRVLRLLLLLGVGLAMMETYLSRGTIGGGDARSYATSAGDVIMQSRAGVFPVWVGQSEYSFHGGIFPLRVAPFLHHAVIAVDWLTGRTLPVFVVLNLTLVASLVAGLFSCYFCLAALLPKRKWTAAMLAAIYAMCPGVVGLAYAQDLYTSFMTLGFLPLVFLGIVRSFEETGFRPRALMVAGLAGAWLAHPPIALWCGFVAAGAQFVRYLAQGWSWRDLRDDSLAAVVFLLLTVYSFVSALSLGRSADSVNVEEFVREVKNAFPGNWLPLRREVPLQNLQLGYTLGAVFLSGAIFGWRRRCLATCSLVGMGAIYLLLLTPIPGLNEMLWRAIPQPILDVTNFWPMQRLFIILALIAVFALAAFLAKSGPFSPWTNRGIFVLTLLGFGWSTFQVRQLIDFANQTAPTVEATAVHHRPENLHIQNLWIAVSMRGMAARFASGGVMDPRLEHRFLDRSTKALSTSLVDAIAPGYGPGGERGQNRAPLAGRFTGTPEANPGILSLEPTLRLEAGRRYLLMFGFRDRPYRGTLILEGEGFRRVYVLPSSGEPFAFGSAPQASRAIPLETSLAHGVELRVRFVPAEDPSSYVDFSDFQLIEYRAEDLPVQVESWIPYRAKVKVTTPIYLVTPRLFIPGYRVLVDGRPVAIETADDGCIAIPLEPGNREVEIRYRPPIMVEAAYWGCALAWLAGGVIAFRAQGRSYPKGKGA